MRIPYLTTKSKLRIAAVIVLVLIAFSLFVVSCSNVEGPTSTTLYQGEHYSLRIPNEEWIKETDSTTDSWKNDDGDALFSISTYGGLKPQEIYNKIVLSHEGFSFDAMDDDGYFSGTDSFNEIYVNARLIETGENVALVWTECMFGTQEETKASLSEMMESVVFVEETSSEVTSDSVVEEEQALNETAPELESISWPVISANPEAFGMENSLDNPVFAEVFYNTYEAPLDKLIAFSLIADGLGEGAGDELYLRFMNAPHTVLTFLALLDNQTFGLAGSGEVSIAEFTCKGIAFADVMWYGTTAEFDNIIAEYRSYYPTGKISELLNILEAERNSAIELADSKSDQS